MLTLLVNQGKTSLSIVEEPDMRVYHFSYFCEPYLSLETYDLQNRCNDYSIQHSLINYHDNKPLKVMIDIMLTATPCISLEEKPNDVQP